MFLFYYFISSNFLYLLYIFCFVFSICFLIYFYLFIKYGYFYFKESYKKIYRENQIYDQKHNNNNSVNSN